MPPGWRDYERLREQSLERWFQRWTPSLDRHDALLPTLALGDNFGFFAKMTGLGRQKWIAEALVEADMWDRQVLVLCPPAVRQHWCQELMKAGLSAQRIEAISGWQASRAGIRNQAALLAKFAAADIVIIEPVARTQTKWFAGMAKLVREASHDTQIVATTTMVWSAPLKPPAYVDSALKLLGYLDDPVKVAWADDSVEQALAEGRI